MVDLHLHIVSFDVPYPPDYGGVIDVFYRIRALSEAGIKVHLHCFQYGREAAAELDKICAAVFYYRRSKSPRYAVSQLPFIVETRKNARLLVNLRKDSHPILFEGLHCTAFLNHPALQGRLKLVRTHNVEHEYYQKLKKVEKNPFKRLFFASEASKLKKYEPILKFADRILAISQKDQEYFELLFGNSILINPFHPNEEMLAGGEKAYAFYHGNLSVSENQVAVEWLLNQVFPLIDVPFVIAGRGASRAVKTMQPKLKNLKIVDSPDPATMLNLAGNASVHVLPTFQNTGFKLKLLYSLYTAPVVIANDGMVSGTNLKAFCKIANRPQEMAQLILKYHHSEPDVENLKKRRDYLREHFSNRENALKIKALLV